MASKRDSTAMVRAELADRLERLKALSARRSSADFASSLAAMRTLASAHGLMPVVWLSQALERAVAESGQGTPRSFPSELYLGRLGDAIGCERMDERASEAMLASVAVRLCA